MTNSSGNCSGGNCLKRPTKACRTCCQQLASASPRTTRGLSPPWLGKAPAEAGVNPKSRSRCTAASASCEIVRFIHQMHKGWARHAMSDMPRAEPKSAKMKLKYAKCIPFLSVHTSCAISLWLWLIRHDSLINYKPTFEDVGTWSKSVVKIGKYLNISELQGCIQTTPQMICVCQKSSECSTSTQLVLSTNYGFWYWNHPTWGHASCRSKQKPARPLVPCHDQRDGHWQSPRNGKGKSWRMLVEKVDGSLVYQVIYGACSLEVLQISATMVIINIMNMHCVRNI